MSWARTARLLRRTGICWMSAALVALCAHRVHATVRTWPNAVSGSASTAANWSPAGAPTAPDVASFPTTGNYKVTWASPQDTLSYLQAITGTPNFAVTGNLGVRNIFSLSLNGRLYLTSGRIRSNQLIVGGTGLGRLIAFGSGTEVVSTSPTAATMFAETLSTTGRVYVMAEAQLLSNSWIETARKSGSQCSVFVNGGNLITRAGSRLGTLGANISGHRGDVILSLFGTTYMDITNGGILDVKGHLVVGQRGVAVLREIDVSQFLDPFINVVGTTYVGYNAYDALPAAQGTLSIEGSIARLGSGLFLGDPDHTSGNSDFGKLVTRGGQTIVGGTGITMPTSLAGSIEMVGGTLQLLSGATVIRQATPFNISSGVAAPTLLVSGTASVEFTPGNGPGLGIGRGGGGRLRIVGAGASASAPAYTVIADSSGGTGVLEVDSSAVFTTAGSLQIGTGGHLTVSNGGEVIVPPTTSTGPDFISNGTIVMNRGTIRPSLGVLQASGSLTGGGTLVRDWENFGSIVIPAAETLEVQGVFFQYGNVSGGGLLKVGTELLTTGLCDATVQAGMLIPYEYSLPASAAAQSPSSRHAAQHSPRDIHDASVPPLGHLHITRDLVLGHLQLRIGSQSDGLRDTLDVDGAVSIGFSALYLSTIPGSTPAPGDTVTLITGGSVTGAFDGVFLDGDTIGTSAQILYTPTAVKLVFLGGTTAVGDDPPHSPAAIELRFSAQRSHGATAFVLELPRASRVRLAMYDVSGREVARLADATLAVGRHEFPLARGSLQTGMYFARAEIFADRERIVKTARAPLLR